jgi:class 3 adenylate cyclase/tetratricopeptide (TPR) repeat protein
MPTATILVTDLVASTELRARLGDEQAERLRRSHDRLLRTAIETHGGTVVKGLGDGVLARFPGATEGVAAAVAIQQAADAHTQRHPDLPLVLRVGLSAGDVTLDGGDVFGTPVVEAARLCAAASGGQILAAEVLRLLLKGRTGRNFRAVGKLDLKGLPEAVVTLEVPWERPASVALPFPDLLRTGAALDFTGRRSELELLTAAWKEAQAGERHSVLVGGEPGVGKTRLATELARSVHEAGATVLYGRCQEGLGVPYEPFVEALGFFCGHTPAHELRSRLGRFPGELGRLLPDLGELVPGLDPPLRSDSETEQYRLFEAVASWLAAAGEAGGLVFVVDDLHWAPTPTLNLLVHVLRAASPARLLVLGTFRDTEISPALTAALADLRRTSTERLSLGGLSIDELSELLERGSHRAAVEPLHEETKGNPFFVGEVLRHLESARDTVPESVREVIVARVARLGPATADVVGVAAVFGRDIELGSLAAVAGLNATAAVDALDQAVAARLMEEAGVGRYRFVHALVRSALYGTLSQNKRVQLHLRAADVEDDVTRLAFHLVASAPLADGDRTARACLGAAERALSALADGEAQDWCSQGLGFVEGPRLRIDLLTALGEAQGRTGDGAFRETLLDASRLAADEGDVARLARAVLANNRGFTSVIGQVDAERLEFLAKALDMVGPAPSNDRAELLALQAVELVFAGDREWVLRAADEAVSIAAGLEDITVRARVGVRWLWACSVPDRVHDMACDGGQIVGLADTTGDHQLRVWSRMVWGWALLATGDLRETRRRTTEAMAIADESGQPGLRCIAHNVHAAVLDALGDHEEAARLTQAAAELGQEAGWPDAMMWYSARMWLHWAFEGQPDIAAAVAAQAFAEYPQMLTWQGAWALNLALCGPSAELARVLAEAPGILPSVPVDIFWANTHFYFAIAQGFGTEEPETAAANYEALLPRHLLHVSFGIGYLGPVEVGMAVAARVLGEVEAALAHHEAAAATIEACGAARARALNGYQWAKTLLVSGDRQRAIEMAEETLAYCRTKGYTTFVTKTEEFLAEFR